MNIGGKPYHSWPSFIIVTFEMTILFAGISAVFGMLALNGLPMPYHPVFNVPRFAFATKDRFFLIVFSSDPKYNPTEAAAFWKAWSRAPSRRCPIKRVSNFRVRVEQHFGAAFSHRSSGASALGHPCRG